jgi:hypothetical protein
MKIKNKNIVSHNFTGIFEYCDGVRFVQWISIEYYKNGKSHREDGPAETSLGGSKIWILNGEYHREDGPAVEYSNGMKSWYLNGRYFSSEKDWEIEVEKLRKNRLK